MPAWAQESPDDAQARIDALEQQLERVLGVVQDLSAEIKSLKNSTQAVAPAPSPATADGLTPIDLSERLDAVAASVEEANTRIDDVEDIAFDIDERVGSRALVRAFDAKSFDLGGFIHTAATFVDGQENDEFAVNRLFFGLLASAQLSDKWSLFVGQAFMRDSDVNYGDPGNRLDPNFSIVNKTPLMLAYATYEHSDALTVDVGRFLTPHGIINIEHFPAILLDPEQPQFLRPFSGQTIFSNFINGAKVSGQVYKPNGINGTLGYSVYAGTYTENSDSVNYGGRAFWSFGDTGVTIGANLGGGRGMGPIVIMCSMAPTCSMTKGPSSGKTSFSSPMKIWAAIDWLSIPSPHGVSPKAGQRFIALISWMMAPMKGIAKNMPWDLPSSPFHKCICAPLLASIALTPAEGLNRPMLKTISFPRHSHFKGARI
ncbi:hypothetical protein [Iodidimonas gelatinilytica]|nr:hypothetical protein [Iodidimonas gelatinilytica]